MSKKKKKRQIKVIILCIPVTLIMQYVLKYGATRMEVDVDGSLSYPEPQTDAKDNGKHFC